MNDTDKRAIEELFARASEATLALPFPEAWREVLVGAYAEGRRAYHTLSHVAEVARQFDFARARVEVHDEPSVFVAILFHDAVYDAKASDNEARSAALAREWIARSNAPVSAERVSALILATASHGAIDARADSDLAVFLDCDLAILGASPADYAAYERGVAYEYAEAYPEDLFRRGRAAFLEKLLAKPRLFASDLFHDTFDARARANVASALAALRLEWKSGSEDDPDT